MKTSKHVLSAHSATGQGGALEGALSLRGTCHNYGSDFEVKTFKDVLFELSATGKEGRLKARAPCAGLGV